MLGQRRLVRLANTIRGSRSSTGRRPSYRYKTQWSQLLASVFRRTRSFLLRSYLYSLLRTTLHSRAVHAGVRVEDRAGSTALSPEERRARGFRSVYEDRVHGWIGPRGRPPAAALASPPATSPGAGGANAGGPAAPRGGIWASSGGGAECVARWPLASVMTPPSLPLLLR